MHTGTVNFSAKTSGLEIEDFSAESEHPSVGPISCSIAENGVIEITAEVIDVYYEDWPNQSIIEEVQQFIDVLSFEFDRPIRSLRRSGYSLRRNDGSGLHQVSASHVAIWDVVDGVVKPGSQSLRQLKQRFRDYHQSSSIRLYSSAIQQEDPIARFMFLYNVVLTLSGDKQAGVDSNILTIAPDTPTTPSPIKPNIQETVYTRLRNEIAHNRVGAEFVATSEEVRQWVQGLGRVVKELVLKNG